MEDVLLLPHEYKTLKKLIKRLEADQLNRAKEVVTMNDQSTENFAHDDAPQQVAIENGRVHQAIVEEINHVLNHCKVVKYPILPGRIKLGSRVKYLQDGKSLILDLVGDVIGLGVYTTQGVTVVSYKSPVGMRLMGKKVGDKFSHKVDGKDTEIEIQSVQNYAQKAHYRNWQNLRV
jgi:transcription elongation GreA/GreB family factor